MKKFLSASAFLLIVVPFISEGQKRETNYCQELLDTELAFSQVSEQLGFAEANFRYLSEEALVFRPFMMKATEFTRLQVGQDSSYRITWYPSFIDVSAAGDLGYGLGPFDNVSSKPGDTTVYNRGQFVTVWRRQPDGAWKFIMDFGSGGLSRREFVKKEPIYKALPMKPSSKKVSADDGNKEWMALEKQFTAECQTHGDVAAMEKFAAPDIRFFYQREFYARGLGEIKNRIGGQQGRHDWTPRGGSMAASGDLAHVYGVHHYKEGATSKEGYYMRLWKKQANGKWTVAVQVRSVVPALPD